MAPAGEKSAERIGALSLVLVTCLWGISFPLVGGAVDGKPLGLLLVFLALRFALASAAFLPLAPSLRRASVGRGLRPWLDSGLTGALLFSGFLLQTAGLVHTTPSRCAFVTMISVPMVPWLAGLWHGRRPSMGHVLASAVALLGVGLVLSPEGRLAPNRGDWLTLASAFFFAAEIVWLEHVARRSPTVILAFGQILSVGLFAALALPFVGFELPDAWPGLWTAVVVTGLLCTTFALGLMTWGQARVRAELAALIFALEPLWAALFEALLSGTTMNDVQWMGGAIVVFAVAAASRVPIPRGRRAAG